MIPGIAHDSGQRHAAEVLQPELVGIGLFQEPGDRKHWHGDSEWSEEGSGHYSGVVVVVVLNGGETCISLGKDKLYLSLSLSHLSQVSPVDEDVVHRLQVETLLDLCERRVEQVRQCHEVQQQAHDAVEWMGS